MDEMVSAAEANRKFSQLLRGVREGRTYVITNHGEPVARLGPATWDRARSDAAFAMLMERWQRQPVIDIGPWTRDELYEDEP
ncbi:MAG: type II toxin-antitoxin system prevent-host-death family antitoxin [Chloroflexota bacterium]|nr:type II toxin-antitoxin system prevent-host-death family antitoxin [Chloroflexota bacterium]